MVLRLNRRDRTLFLSALAAVGILAAVGFGVSRFDPPPAEAPPSAPPDAARPDASGQITPESGHVPDKVQDRPGTPAQIQARQALELEPPYLIQDGLTFAAGPVAVRLADLEGPPAQATCRDGNGSLWACGLQARAALNNEIRSAKIHCTATDVLADGLLQASCRMEGGDLGEQLARLGWARPSDPRSPRYAASEDARRAGRGLWNGDWTIAERGPLQAGGADLRKAFDMPQSGAGD